MKGLITIIALLVFVSGCSQSSSISQVEERPQAITIEEKMAQCHDVDELVVWLKNQPNITDVRASDPLLLTSDPPQVIVSFNHNGVKESVHLYVESKNKLALVKPNNQNQP